MPTAAELGERTATEVPLVAAESGSAVEPGVLFFAGGLAVLLAAFAVRHWQR